MSSRLLLRSRPKPAESLQSFLLRLSASNGFVHAGQLLRLARLPGDFHAAPCGLDTLQRLLDDAAAASELEGSASWPIPGRQRMRRFNGRAVCDLALDTSHPKVCPACLAESAAAPLHFDLRLVTSCPRHEINLVDCCHACGRRLTWLRAGPARCRCGASMLRCTASAPSSAVHAISSALVRWAGTVQHARTDLAPVRDLNEASRLLWFVGTSQGREQAWRSRFISRPPVAAMREIVEAAAPVLLDWPAGLHAWLDRHLVVGAGRTGVHDEFGAVLRRARAALADLHAVLEEMKAHLGSHSIATAPRPTSFFSLPAPTPPRLSGTETAKSLGISVNRVARLIEAGELDGEARKMGRRTLYLVPPSGVTACRTRLAAALDAAQVARLLGISRFQVDALMRAGHLRPDPLTLGRVPAESLEELLRRLAAQAVEIAQPGMVTLPALAKDRRRRLAEVIGAALNRRLTLFSTGNGVGLSRFAVKASDVLGTSGEAGEFVGIRRAARELGMHPRMMPVLARAGCIDTKHRRRSRLGHRSIATESLAAFRRDYVTTREIAARTGTNTRTVCERLRSGGVKPVVAPDASRGISAVWRRREAER